MARDSSLYLRESVVALLNRSDPPCPVWPQRAPAGSPYERIQYGQPIAAPFTAGCLDGSRVTFAVHSYAETTGEGDATVGGEQRAHDLTAWVVTMLGGEGEHALSLDLTTDSDCPYPATAHIEWTQSQVLSDGLGTDAFHGIASFTATIVS